MELLSRLGGVASVAYLTSLGVCTADVDRAIRRGTVFRPRRGWLAVHDADPILVSAARLGGRLSCTSALERLGAWVPPSGTHLRIVPTARRLSPPPNVRLHRVAAPEGPIIDTPAVALIVAVRCLGRVDAICLLDSVLNRRIVPPTTVRSVLEAMPARYRTLVTQIDATAQSGLETRARLACRSLRIPYRSQVWIEGAGRVDLLVGDRLVLELDGERWHAERAAFHEDRRRDLALTERGYLVLRLSYAQVMSDWARAESVLRAMVARNEHRWSARHRRAGLVHLPFDTESDEVTRYSRH